MKNKLFLKGFWLLLVSASMLLAGKQHFRFERISMEQGLPGNSMGDILQCSKGFMWIALYGGLCRYDGIEFKTYSHDPRDKTTVSSNLIWCLTEDRFGMLWIGTSEKGINRFDPGKEVFTRFRHDPGNPGSLSHDMVRAVYEDTSGTIWVGTWNGLDRFDRDTGTFTHFRHDPGDAGSLSNNSVWKICEDARGNLWIGTSNGLNCFNKEMGSFKHYLQVPANLRSSSSNYISSMFPDPDGSLWIGSNNKGLIRFDPVTHTVTRYYHNPDDPGSLGGNKLWVVFKDSADRLWVGTDQGGLNLFNPQTGTFTRFRHDPADPGSFSPGAIFSIYEDRSGVLWIGTELSGIIKFDGKPQKFILYKNIYNEPGSLNHNVVSRLYEDRFGNIWIGTYGGGLNRFTPGSETFVHFKHEPGNPRSLSSNKISGIAEDNRGSLWVATERSGLNKFHRETRDFTRFAHDPADSSSLSSNRIFFLYKDRDGVLWVGTFNRGLNRLVYKKDPDTGRERETFAGFMHDPKNSNSPGSNGVRCMLEDRSGIFWLASRFTGVTRYDRKKGIYTRFLHDPGNPNSVDDFSIVTIYEDTKGRLWFGTRGAGLQRFDRERKIFIHYTKTQGFPDNYINGILEDNAGYLWISTRNKLCRFNPETGDIKTYDSDDGLQSGEFFPWACLKDREGRMYFGGFNGFNVFRPEAVRDNLHIPPIVLTSFKIFEKEVKLFPPIWSRKAIRLPYDRNFFSIRFAALDFTRPGKNRYAYKMEGLNNKWTSTGSRNYVNFTDLDPGTYTFKARGSNNDNVWNLKGVSLVIDIIPPFWMTWWFKVLSALVFAVVSYFVIVFLKRYAFFFAFWKKKSFIGHYRIVDKIASGGSGIIYKAEDLLDKSRPLALKVMKEECFTDKAQVKRFKNEAAIIDRLKHPNIIKVVERGEHAGQIYMSMELIKGLNLWEFLETQKDKKLEISTASAIIAQVANAMVAVHIKDIVHRDLKPANIMITRKKENPYFVTLLDFGLARARDITRLTQTGIVMGTAHYLSPELITLSEVSCAGDVYSLGIICYEMLTGQKPFEGPTNEILLNNILNKEPKELKELRPDIPAQLNRTIMAMINKKPGDRPTMEEIPGLFSPFGG
jgi:ligand-binding sensor domain-containing protein/tRNA A-37 threonylcarbamoyl transferase component Bud32